MLSGDETENKPVKKSAQRKGKTQQEGTKAEARKRKPAARQELQADQLPEVAETVSAPVVSTENAPMEPSPSEVAPVVMAAPPEIEPRQDPQADPLFEAAEATTVPVTLPENMFNDAPPAEGGAIVPVAAAEVDAVNYQTIVDAYRHYTQQSLDQTQSFFGRLAGVRSLDKAVELQTEFAKQAYDGFVAESRRIRELHGQLARQRLQRWEGFVARMISPR
jgi:hypothetical protein